MIYDGKMKQTHFRSTSNTSHSSKIKQMPFRTLLKRRNDTISASQLYQDHPSLKQSNIKQNLSHSNILSQKLIQNTPPPVAIKDYVKKMARKIVKNRSTVMLETVNTAQIQDDKLSQKSTRSVISNSHFYKKQIIPLAKEEKGSLEELEKRVQTLIAETIGQIKRQKSAVGISTWLKTQNQQISYEKELQYIMAWLKELTERQEVPGQKFEDLNRKIIMIEKLLARESIQGDVFQGMYFNWKTQRGNTTSFVSKSALKQSKKYNNVCSDQKSLYKQAIKSRQIVSNYDSTNSNSFKRPPKQFYHLSKEKKNSYSANRQPFPRSSYSAQYLNYGKFGTYSYKASETRDYPETSLAVKASTYQQEYKEKLGLTKSINFKDLDCFKNKFHNSNISFMNSSKKKANAKVEQKKIDQKGAKQNLDATFIKKSQQSLLGCMSMSCNSFFKSEHQKEYFWHNAPNLDETKNPPFCQIKSQIKDKRLDKLKDTFKSLAIKR